MQCLHRLYFSMQAYQIVLIIFAAIALLLFLTAIFCLRFVFGKRYDKNPKLRYFTAEDFNLKAQTVLLQRGLNGFLYSADTEQNGNLIIFCHGLGAGQCEYTTEIAYFCNEGNTVLAVDSTGCGYSEGKSIKGMYEGVKTAISAIDYAETLKFKKIFLVGHSWGAYSALCASSKRKVDGVVAISAPISTLKMFTDIAGHFLGYVLAPFVYLAFFFKFGINGNLNSAKCAQKNGTKTLLIHGDKDKVVKLNSSAFAKAKGEHTVKYLAEGKAHNPYNTENAEKLLAELSAKFQKHDLSDISQFDFVSATEEDKEVMQKIINFIEA